MQREPGCLDTDRSSIERLSDALLDLAGTQDVRVIEALAAVFRNRQRAGLSGWPGDLAEPADQRRLTSPVGEADGAARRAICRRIASRALRGSLVDPTRGATTVHRIDAIPAWSRDLLPIGMFGPFLFYRLTPGQLSSAQDPHSPDVCATSSLQAVQSEAPDSCWWPGSPGSGPDWMAS